MNIKTFWYSLVVSGIYLEKTLQYVALCFFLSAERKLGVIF